MNARNPLIFEEIWLSVDPGLRHTAIALWKGSRLVRAGLVKNTVADSVRDAPAWAAMGAAVAARVASWTDGDFRPGRVVVEIPQVYQHARGVNPDDLLQLAGVDGAILGVFGAPCVSYRPASWKGQTPKEITQARTDAALAPEEKAAIEWPAKSLQHNVWDAVAIGLAHLRLTGRARG